MRVAVLPSRPSPDPFLAALVDLLLPEWDSLLQLVDRVLARGEGVLSVRRGNGDHDRGVPNSHTSNTVVDGDAGERVARAETVCDLRHHALRHAFVRFVVEVCDRA